MIVFVHVTDNTKEGYITSDIPILIKGNNQSPDSFQEVETGTNVKLGFGKNINIQVHQNSVNDARGQTGNILTKTSFKDNPPVKSIVLYPEHACW